MIAEKHVLGIDIGGTKIAYAVGDERGELSLEERRPTEATDDVEADFRRIADEAAALIERFRKDTGGCVDAVGVSAPGPLDESQGTLLRAVNIPAWKSFPIRDFLRQALGLPVFLANDTNGAALAEWRFGAARGAQHALYLSMSTGVGAGLILNGRLYSGVGGSAGELGHTVIDWEGERCGCGRSGCLEAYVGGKCWGERLKKSTPDSSQVLELAGGNRQAISPEDLVKAAKQGDPFALQEMEQFNEVLAKGLANFIFAFAPEVIVLGTICVAAGEDLCFEPLRRKTRELLWDELSGRCKIVPSGLGERLGPLAGVSVGLQGLSEGS